MQLLQNCNGPTIRIGRDIQYIDQCVFYHYGKHSTVQSYAVAAGLQDCKTKGTVLHHGPQLHGL